MHVSRLPSLFSLFYLACFGLASLCLIQSSSAPIPYRACGMWDHEFIADSMSAAMRLLASLPGPVTEKNNPDLDAV